jgi:hypothetical protein
LIIGNVIRLSPLLLGQTLVVVGLLLFSIADRQVGLLPSWGFWLWLVGRALALGAALCRVFAAPVQDSGFAE